MCEVNFNQHTDAMTIEPDQGIIDKQGSLVLCRKEFFNVKHHRNFKLKTVKESHHGLSYGAITSESATK